MLFMCARAAVAATPPALGGAGWFGFRPVGTAVVTKLDRPR